MTGQLPKRLPLKPTDLVVETQVERSLQDEAIALDIDLMIRTTRTFHDG